MRRTVFLDKRRDVELIRTLQRMQRSRGRAVVVKHKTLAKKLNCSESSVRRSIERLVKQGHIIRTYISRDRGGRLCAYYVDTEIIYRQASLWRRAKAKIEQVLTERKVGDDGTSGSPQSTRSKDIKHKEIDNKRSARPSLVGERDQGLLAGLMEVAKAVGIDDRQRGFLRSAALKYGVREAWRALQIAFDGGYRIADLVKVTWGILRRQYPEGVVW